MLNFSSLNPINIAISIFEFTFTSCQKEGGSEALGIQSAELTGYLALPVRQ